MSNTYLKDDEATFVELTTNQIESVIDEYAPGALFIVIAIIL